MRHGLIGIGLLTVALLAGAVPSLGQADAAAPEVGQPDHGQLYDLCVTCAWSAGDAYRWSSNEYERTTITWGQGEAEEVESDTYLTYGITANSVIDEVDEDHQVVSVTHRIERLYLLEDDLLPPGTVLRARRRGERTVYTVGGDRVENETLLYVLNRVANLHVEPSRDYNALLQVPKTPQPIGARWAIDGPAFARAMADERLDIDADEATGEVHFVRAQDVFGVPGLALDLHFELDATDPVFEEAFPERELVDNTLAVEAELLGAQSDEHLEQGVELSARLTQTWRDPETDREGTVVIYSESSAGQRTLSPRERELLGFD